MSMEMKQVKFGDIVRQKTAIEERAVVVSPMDDNGYFYIVSESNQEFIFVNIDDCDVITNEFIRLCRMAEQQITGFRHARDNSADIGVLLSSMGLQKIEWEYIKSEIGVNWLENELQADIETYFSRKNETNISDGIAC